MATKYFSFGMAKNFCHFYPSFYWTGKNKYLIHLLQKNLQMLAQQDHTHNQIMTLLLMSYHGTLLI